MERVAATCLLLALMTVKSNAAELVSSDELSELWSWAKESEQCAQANRGYEAASLFGYRNQFDTIKSYWFVGFVSAKIDETHYCIAGSNVLFEVLPDSAQLTEREVFNCKVNRLASTDDYVAINCNRIR